jgi:flagellar hook assembly protein FlgD
MRTEIRYHLAWAQHIELAIFDVNGRRLVTLVEAMHPAGDYKIRWQGQDANGVQMPSGIYFCQLRVGRSSIATRKMTLLR